MLMGYRQLWKHIDNAMEIVKTGEKLDELLWFATFAKVFYHQKLFIVWYYFLNISINKNMLWVRLPMVLAS